MYNIKQKPVTFLSTFPRGTQCMSETTRIGKVRNCGHKSQEGIKKSPLMEHFNEMKPPFPSLEFIGIDYVLKACSKGETGAAYLDSEKHRGFKT